MKERLLFIGTALALFSYGCGSSDGGGSADTPIANPAAEAAADGAVTSTQTLTELKNEPTSGGALSAMSGMYGQLSSMATAGSTGIAGFAEVSSAKASFDTCVTATDTLITYADCDYGSTRIDGTVGVNGDSFSANLTLNTAAAGTAIGFTMVGSLTVTATLIDGSIAYDTNISGVTLPGGVGGLKLTANYDNIGLDGMGCPTSGSLTVRQSASGAFDFGDVRAEFGPACGDVQLYN